MKPDFGVYLNERGLRDVIQHFYGVGIDRVDAIGARAFSTMLNNEVDGSVYAVSFDYGLIRLAELVSFAEEPVRLHIANSVRDGGWTPRPIPLDVPLIVSVEARVGKPQLSPTEVFAPLVVQRIFI